MYGIHSIEEARSNTKYYWSKLRWLQVDNAIIDDSLEVTISVLGEPHFEYMYLDRAQLTHLRDKLTKILEKE